MILQPLRSVGSLYVQCTILVAHCRLAISYVSEVRGTKQERKERKYEITMTTGVTSYWERDLNGGTDVT